jgi:hypothetical protein
MWNEIWQFLVENYVYNAAIVLAVIYLIFSGKVRMLLRKLFGKIMRLKFGPIELQVDDDIDPNMPCPYTKSRDLTFSALRDVNQKVDKLAAEVKEIIVIIKNLSIDQQKQLFYDKDQPILERLAGGLNYLYLGGNSDTGKDVIVFVEQHNDLYKALTYKRPELRLKSE